MACAQSPISRAVPWPGEQLRETAKKDPAYVIARTREHLDLMSGVTFSEAVRRLSPEQAARLEAIRARTRFSEVSV